MAKKFAYHIQDWLMFMAILATTFFIGLYVLTIYALTIGPEESSLPPGHGHAPRGDDDPTIYREGL